MKYKSIRAFIGAKDFTESRHFYQELGFNEVPVSSNMSYFSVGDLGFYLQDYYVKDWVDNSMVFMEVDNARQYQQKLADLNLSAKFKTVKLSSIQEND